MEIISKRDGPRREDEKARRLLKENAGTIRRLADTISNGGFTRMREQEAARREQPKPAGLIIHHGGAAARNDAPEPYVKVSRNGRVVLVDLATGRQLQMLGEIRGGGLSRRFVAATAANGFLSPLDDETFAAIADLAEVGIGRDMREEDLAAALEERLGLRAR